MPEKFKFQPEVITKYQEKIEEIKKEGGFLLEKKGDRNIISFLGIRTSEMQKRDAIIEFETEIDDKKEIQEILEEMRFRQTPLFRKIFTFIIDTYNQERIPLLQSVPGTGKTYAYILFNKLLHGKDAPVEYLQCSPRTSELELVGHWSPKGEGVGAEEIRTRLEKVQKWQDFKGSFEKELQNLLKRKDNLSEEEFQKEFSGLTKNFMETQREILLSMKGNASDYVFRKGALLSAFKDPRNPKDEGRFVIIDEIDNLPPNYQNILLQLSAPGGKLTKKFTSYSDSGVTDYKKGDNTFVALAANYPEISTETGKRAISSPLADRVDFLSILPKESVQNEEVTIQEHAFSSLTSIPLILKEKSQREENNQLSTKENTQFPKRRLKKKTQEDKLRESLSVFKEADPQVTEELRNLLAKSLAFLHREFKTRLAEFKKEGLELAGGGTRFREQDKEFSQRTAVGFENYILSHFNDPDFLNTETGELDIAKLFLTAFEEKYLSFLASSQLKVKFYNEVIYPFVYAGAKRIVSENGRFIIKEMPKEVRLESPFLYVEEGKHFRSFNPNGDKLEDALPLNKVFDILVERTSLNQKDKYEQEEEEKKLRERQTKQRKFDIGDIVQQLKEDSDIPEEIRKLLG